MLTQNPTHSVKKSKTHPKPGSLNQKNLLEKNLKWMQRPVSLNKKSISFYSHSIKKPEKFALEISKIFLYLFIFQHFILFFSILN